MSRNTIYKAFANEQRLKLLKCLQKPKNVTEMLDHCSLTQSALSQHLRVLRDAGLVTTERKSKEIQYQLKSRAVIEIVNQLLHFT